MGKKPSKTSKQKKTRATPKNIQKQTHVKATKGKKKPTKACPCCSESNLPKKASKSKMMRLQEEDIAMKGGNLEKIIEYRKAIKKPILAYHYGKKYFEDRLNPRILRSIAKDPEVAFYYAIELEFAHEILTMSVAKDPKWAYYYALVFGEAPNLQKAAAQDPTYNELYFKNVTNRSDIEIEKLIRAKNSFIDFNRRLNQLTFPRIPTRFKGK